MFWDSVVRGLSVLLHWQAYVAMLEFVAIMMVPRVLLGMLLMRDSGPAALGCLVPFALVVVQMVAVIIFVMTMAPLLLGFQEGAAWAFPWTFMTAVPWTFIKLVLTTGFVGIVLSIVRLDLFANALMGCSVLAYLALNLDSLAGVRLWPGFWFMAGILVVSGALLWLGFLLIAGVPALFGRNGTAVGQMVAYPVGALLMFLPVFIYGGWLVQQASHA